MTRRFGMVCRMRPELREGYLALHAAVCPGVEATIARPTRRVAEDAVTQEW